LQQLAAEQPGSNIFISPYSASTALQMVSTGAAGTTETEMQQALCATNLKPIVLAEGNRNLGAIINARNTNFILSTANAIWYRKGTPIVPAFIAINRAYFRACVEGLNFNEPSAVDVINAWASAETHGKIDQILQGPIPATVRLFLNNAVYFLGNWENPFDTNLTTDEAFNLSGGGQTTVPMMHRTGLFGYYAGENYQALRLPYKGNKLAMYVFLPGPDSSVEDLLNAMNGAWWQQAMNAGFIEQQGAIALPKFNLSFAASLVPALQALGMETAFTPDADFAKISREPLYISDVKQQAVVEVNEKGSEAAAVTTITIGIEADPGGPFFQMIVDRPFLFFIEDEQAGTILFNGAVFDP
jgi:serpin B